MRNLTIKRTKSFVACLATLKVYLEDTTGGETVINGTPCRKIGVLKNGEEKTFSVDDGAAKVYVIADQLSKGYCSDCYQLPEGREDIVLTGKNRFSLSSGNAFRFDNNDSEESRTLHRRGKGIGLLFLIAAIAIGFVVGRSVYAGVSKQKAAMEKTFSSTGMTITLTEQFREAKADNYTVAYESKDVAVLALREDFSLAEGFETLSLDDYRDILIQSNQLSAAEKKTVNGIPCFEYSFTNQQNNNTYQFYSFVYKTDNAFWLVQFAVQDKNAPKYEQQIASWAEKIRFS